MSDERKALMLKLGRARKAVAPIEKTGSNEDEKFKFVEAVAVVEEANRVLTNRGILILPSVESSGSKQQGAGVLTKVEVTYEIVDTDTGYGFEKKGVGHGFDLQGDRAVYKAITGANKYFLIGLLSIPVVGGDPEDDGAGAAPGEPGQSPEAQEVRAEQDAAAEAPDITPRHELPLPESDLPEPDWTGLEKPEPAHA